MMTDASVLLKTELPLPMFVRGKVRDSYGLGERLLIVATDRISAFDWIALAFKRGI
jgi:phosphoribosylaminoimidazole-succinocarboxamide synthase